MKLVDHQVITDSMCEDPVRAEGAKPSMNSDCPPWPRMVVGTVSIDLIDREKVLALIQDTLSASNPLAVVSANVDHIHHFAQDESWVSRPSAESVNGSGEGIRWLTLLDGVPLVRTANALSGRKWPKLSGSDLINPILESAAILGARVGFLGGGLEAHRKLRQVVGDRLPDLCIAGTWAPTRGQLTDAEASRSIAAEIRDARVEILVVGLGKPLQEEWITRYGLDTGAKVLLAFGAAVDFLADRVRRAPKLIAKAGGEWAWRLALEPRRLSKRYLIDGPPVLLYLKRSARVIEHPATFVAPVDVERGRFVSREQHAEVAAIAVTHNNSIDISRLIDSLRVAAGKHAIRCIVVDNNSSDDTVEVARSHHDLTVVDSGGNLGYAGGINAGLPLIDDCEHVLILNPDLALAHDAVTRLLDSLADNDRIGAVVPLVLDEDGGIQSSLFREPSIARAFGDALLGGKVLGRPSFSSEFDLRGASYRYAHDVDWATGAALLMPASVVREIGEWNDTFFLYSEEVDYFRRIRESGRLIRFEPSAVVKHRGGGSGRSPALANLKAVNRVRYIEMYHGRLYSATYRAVVALSELLRSYDALHRRTLVVILSRKRWQDLPSATSNVAQQGISGPRQRGAVIIPAYNEAAIIKRTLAPLSRMAVDGYVELIVVCNGCTDDTANEARMIPGVRVLELEQGSKTAAINAGDEVAALWPRLYLDADVHISPGAVLAVLDRLNRGDVMVAAPASQYDWLRASALVRCYYRAQARIPQHKLAMWSAGAYGLTERGHARFGRFPTVTGDDLFVDTQFDAHEKVVVATDPAIRITPADTKNLLTILRRHRRGDAELLTREHLARTKQAPNKSIDTARAVVATIRGPRSAADALAYLGMSVARRWRPRWSTVWERDESSRSTE